MTKSVQPHLMLDRKALTHIQQYLPPDEATFLSHAMVQEAILMRLQEIGENLTRMRHIDEDAFAGIAADSWNQLIGLRNIISHGYHQIRPEQIWQIITEELPTFAATIDAMAEDLRRDAGRALALLMPVRCGARSHGGVIAIDACVL